MKEKTKENLSNLVLVLSCSLVITSFLNGKVYNDFQNRIEKNNKIIEEDNDYNNYCKRENEKLIPTRDFTKNNPFYFPFGLLYDVANKRI
jgi:hypothetical protein